jgi:hypothetical protein
MMRSPLSKLAAITAAAVLAGIPAVDAGEHALGIIPGLLTSLADYHNSGSPADNRQVSFELPESVLNLYLKSVMQPRPMIDEIQVRLAPRNRCTIEAKVDFDAVAKAEPALFSKAQPQAWKGWKLVRAELRFTVSSRGTLTFTVVPLPAGDILPAGVLSEIVRVVARHQPEQIDTTKEIPLPFGLRQLWTVDKVLGGRT